MDFKNLIEGGNIDLSRMTKKFVSAEGQITGPTENKDGSGRMHYTVRFLMETEDDDGYISQSKFYTKTFFEDSHSVVFAECQRCQEAEANGIYRPLKIKLARVTIPTLNPDGTQREFYILDANGKKQKRKDGQYRKASSITLVLLPDENPITAFKAQVDRLTLNNAWVKTEGVTEEFDAEEEKEKELKKSEK